MDLSPVTDTDLARMIDRAYWKAAREWQDARASKDAIVRLMLAQSARTAEDYHRQLKAEQTRRQTARVTA